LRPGYRIQQFLDAVRSTGKPVGAEVLRPHLSPAQIELFHQMPASEQRHAVSVLKALQREQHGEAELMQAALLHDVGRFGGHVRLWHRVATVLLQAIHPALFLCLASDEAGSWRYPFYAQLHHASLGAELAARVGTDKLTVALIRWHHTAVDQSDLDPRGRTLLSALQGADDRS
jgi:hypothetical protein